MSSIAKETTTRTCKYWMNDSERILYGEVIPGSELDLADVKENYEMRKDFLDIENPMPMILNIGKILKISKEARTFSASPTSTEGLSCLAMLIDSGLSKVIGNYALILNKPKIPTKLFTSVADAKVWIQQYQ